MSECETYDNLHGTCNRGTLGCSEHHENELDAPSGSTVVAWQKGVLRVHDKDDLDCTDVHVLTIDGRTVLRAIVPVHGLGDPVSDTDRKLIGQALAEYLANDQDEGPLEAK